MPVAVCRFGGDLGAGRSQRSVRHVDADAHRELARLEQGLEGARARDFHQGHETRHREYAWERVLGIG